MILFSERKKNSIISINIYLDTKIEIENKRKTKQIGYLESWLCHDERRRRLSKISTGRQISKVKKIYIYVLKLFTNKYNRLKKLGKIITPRNSRQADTPDAKKVPTNIF